MSLQNTQLRFFLLLNSIPSGASLMTHFGKESASSLGDLGLIPGLGRSSGEENRLPTPVFLPREFCGQTSLVGYSPWGGQELDTTEAT